MALNANALASDMESGVRSAMSLGATPYPQLTSYCQAIATAIVNHLKNNAELNNASGSGNTGTVANPGGGYPITNLPVSGGIK